MIQLTEPQVWTMIGVFTALMFGMLTTVSTLFVRVIRSEIGGLDGKIGGLDGKIGGLDGKIGGLRGELDGKIGGLRGELGGLRGEMNARFDAMNVKFDGIDRDIQLLMRREFGIDRD